jgi:hypothetical protein
VKYDDLQSLAIIRFPREIFAEIDACGLIPNNATCDPLDALRLLDDAAARLARGSVARRFE